MAFLKTILTYHLPSEAEVDKSLLESHGLTVNLLNAHTTRNELGAPFHIRLQVPEEQVNEAVAIIRQYNPERFGSVENVRQIERELVRTLLTAFAWIGAAIAVVYVLTPDDNPDPRWVRALSLGFGLGIISYGIFALLRRKKT